MKAAGDLRFALDPDVPGTGLELVGIGGRIRLVHPELIVVVVIDDLLVSVRFLVLAARVHERGDGFPRVRREGEGGAGLPRQDGRLDGPDRDPHARGQSAGQERAPVEVHLGRGDVRGGDAGNAARHGLPPG